MSREWKPGDVCSFLIVGKRILALRDNEGRWNAFDGPGRSWVSRRWDNRHDQRPLVVIDPKDREQVERLIAIWRTEYDHHDRTLIEGGQTDALQAALREYADPKPPLYREHHSRWAPWPITNECHSSHHEDHECPQCAWEHDHDWVAWIDPKADVVSGPGVPIRCSKCGARKCDADDCALMRHTHTHSEGVTS